MTLQELFAGQGIDWKHTKLARHNKTRDVIAGNVEAGLLEVYQSIQGPATFREGDTVISFLGEEGTTGVYQGCYRVGNYRPFDRATLPDELITDPGMEQCVIYDMTSLDILPELKDRLVIDWGKGTKNWCHRGTTSKEILEIRPYKDNIHFENYEKVILSFGELKTIIHDPKAHKLWYDKLSAVAGVYLITDTKTGKLYVGSASGEQGGIWGRWSEYVRTKHGGNKKLIKLIEEDPDYCENFQFSILEVVPLKRDRNDVLELEKLYKRKLLSILYGYNDN